MKEHVKGIIVVLVVVVLLVGVMIYYLSTTDGKASSVKEVITEIHNDLTPSSHRPSN